MKHVLLQIVGFLLPALVISQNIQVDSQTYTPQQLVEDILIDSNCIENVVVTNVVGGNFGNSERSYGFFSANGSDFPFASGIVLSTGKITNAQGPNTTLSDDDASNWIGDSDLEAVLNEPNTLNATILEFDFTSVASQISFRYIFASEEYQEGDANTCQYSDLFGFLIRPDGANQYTNIAVVPGTQTPVKVTTVHPEIANGCQAVNEAYFESFNGSMSPINFNGQTKILTAVADVVPNELYHVKLVIADEQNYRFDSAVFLEAGSFQLATDLGPDLLRENGNAICSGETYDLDAAVSGGDSFIWYKDDMQLLGETDSILTVTEPGIYTVEVTLPNGCISYGEVFIEFYSEVVAIESRLTECDPNQDGVTVYNLYDAEQSIVNNNAAVLVSNYFFNENDALLDRNPIPNPSSFQNSFPSQVVYARAETQARCFKVAQLQLEISNNTLTIPEYFMCDDMTVDGYTNFNFNAITATFQNQIPNDATIAYYETENDAFNDTNNLSSPYQNTQINSQTLFVKVRSNNQCYAISPVILTVLYKPTLQPDDGIFYCENNFPKTIRIFGGVIGDSPSNYSYEWLFNGTTTSVNTSFNDINVAGVYTAIVTHPNGCSASRTITVTNSNSATIENIAIIQGSYINSVTIEVSGDGLYEYILDEPNGFYQESNVFNNIRPGFHTVYVRDINGCGIVGQLISVLGFPRYFTPNGDAFHDTWKVYGVNAQFNRGIDIMIFNRYGKILAQQDHLSSGWDGTFNGQLLPSDDYWYVVTLQDGSMYRGHFSLVR